MSSEHPIVFSQDMVTPRFGMPVGPWAGGAKRGSSVWRVLVVDDDREVHAATRIALDGVTLLGDPVELTHAHSADEAIEILRREGDGHFAVALLDVVMEAPDAGLEIIDTIRSELRIMRTRIVLRTGHPGRAPEAEVIMKYEIDDYRTKSELSRGRLITTLAASCRAFRQLGELHRQRLGLEAVLSATASIDQADGVVAFARGALEQLAGQITAPAEGFVCGVPPASDGEELAIIVAVGRHADLLGTPLAEVRSATIRSSIERAIARHTHEFAGDYTVIYIGSDGYEGAVFLPPSPKRFDGFDRQLLRVFAGNIATGIANAALFERARRLAHYDPVTGLPNRVLFTVLLGLAASSDKPQTAALIDIRRFGELYHALGQSTGSGLLEAIASRLAEDLPGCALARVGSDVFGVVGPSSRVVPPVLRRAFQLPFNVGIHSLVVDVSIGLVLVEPDHKGEELLRRADIALREAKGRPDEEYFEYRASLDEAVSDDVRLIGRLRRAFDRHDLTLHFQPQFDAQTEQLVGVEALARWPTADGFIPPGRFIPLAERTGLIRNLGSWALHEAARCGTLLREARPDLEVSVNVSVEQLRRSGFRAEVERAIKDATLSSSAITLELTESSLAAPSDELVRELESLRTFGTRISLDDFGTGYASFGYLRWLPIDELKLDKVFVDDVTSVDGSLLCRTIVDLGRALGFKIVAEGVETRAQLEFLKAMGVDRVQGYLLGRPMPMDDILALARG